MPTLTIRIHGPLRPEGKCAAVPLPADCCPELVLGDFLSLIPSRRARSGESVPVRAIAPDACGGAAFPLTSRLS